MPQTESDFPIPLSFTFPPQGNSGVIILGMLMKTLSTRSSLVIRKALLPSFVHTPAHNP